MVNIGILRSISHHFQCLNSQQLFYYIISKIKKVKNNIKKLLDHENAVVNLNLFSFLGPFHKINEVILLS